jgi:hypothetical protein
MSRRDAGITLVEILAAVTVVAVIVALIIPVHARAARYQTLKECQDHLHTLFEAQGKAPPTKVQELGRAYWVRLTQLTPPLVTPDALKCPFVEGDGAPFCQYLGPAGEIDKLEAKDPIGCDMDQNHSADRKQGGNLLLKNGQVVTDHTNLWATTIQLGKCRP